MNFPRPQPGNGRTGSNPQIFHCSSRSWLKETKLSLARSWCWERQGHPWEEPLSPPCPVPTPWGPLLFTHCPPAGGWSAGRGAGGHGPGCHSGSGSKSGHSVGPVGSQGAEVRAVPEVWVQESTAFVPGPDSLVF